MIAFFFFFVASAHLLLVSDQAPQLDIKPSCRAAAGVNRAPVSGNPAIEAALVSAVKKHYSETDEITVQIDRQTGAMQGFRNGEALDADIVGRVGAQTAKQVIIQKIREAERDSLYDEYDAMVGDMITGARVWLYGSIVRWF